MRAVIQRVSQASVNIHNNTHTSIKQGLVIFLGIESNDNIDDIVWLTGKIQRLRIFNDAQLQMNLSISDINGEILIISQFTLFASTKKGNRPSYIRAARPETAITLYRQFIQHMQTLLPGKVQTGKFGEHMQISMANDGPVTIIIDTKNKE